jgi:hypothetical protein
MTGTRGVRLLDVKEIIEKVPEKPMKWGIYRKKDCLGVND